MENYGYQSTVKEEYAELKAKAVNDLRILCQKFGDFHFEDKYKFITITNHCSDFINCHSYKLRITLIKLNVYDDVVLHCQVYKDYGETCGMIERIKAIELSISELLSVIDMILVKE